MGSVLNTIGEGVSNALLMAWDVWWALVAGFAISAAVQAWVPRERVERALGGHGLRTGARAAALGAASSSCSYAAVAIAKTLFERGASASSSLAFQFASTNLVAELGIVMWVLLGWRFTVAELLGGVIGIVLVSWLSRVVISRAGEARAREHARHVVAAHHHHGGDGDDGSDDHHDHGAGRHDAEPPTASARDLLGSAAAWREAAVAFRADWGALYRELTAGFLLAGFVGLLPDHVFASVFVQHAPGAVRLAENVAVAPLLAAATMVCSVGNVPLAAVLWSGGASFAGVMAFIFADLLALPIIVIYRKYFGARFAARIVLMMYAVSVLAALAISGLAAATGLTPTARPSRSDIFGEVTVDYTLVLNVLATAAFAVLLALARPRRGGPSRRRSLLEGAPD